MSGLNHFVDVVFTMWAEHLIKGLVLFMLISIFYGAIIAGMRK